MRDTVQPGTPLVVGINDVPRRPAGTRGGKHVVTRPGIIIPAFERLQVHRAELPDLSRIVYAGLKTAFLFRHADVKPVFDELDA